MDSDWLFLLVLGWLFQADSNIVTHDKGICKFADRIIEMKNGKLQEQNIK